MGKFRKFSFSYFFFRIFIVYNVSYLTFFPPPTHLYSVKFVELIDDERCGNIFEAIIGTLRAARRCNAISFNGEFLLKGVHDDVMITVV